MKIVKLGKLLIYVNHNSSKINYARILYEKERNKKMNRIHYRKEKTNIFKKMSKKILKWQI